MKTEFLKNRLSNILSQPALIVCFCATLIYSCKRGDDRLIPEKELIDVLTEIHVADGLLSIQSIRGRFSSKDSTSNYMDILERHGLTKKRMDNTLSYYFNQNPKKLENIYDRVLIKLNEKQTSLENLIVPVKPPQYNLWPDKYFIAVPESGVKNPVWFSIHIKDTGSYVLNFSADVFNDDQSINPRTTIFFWHTDSSKTENRKYWPEVSLIKDMNFHEYSLSEKITDSVYNHIGGWLLNSDPKEGRWEKHAQIQNIKLYKAGMQ
jgi:hypothetical protein